MDWINIELFEQLVSVLAQYGPVAIGLLLLLIAERRISNSVNAASSADKKFYRTCYVGLMASVGVAFAIFTGVHTYKQFETEGPTVFSGDLNLQNGTLKATPYSGELYIQESPPHPDTDSRKVKWVAIDPPKGGVDLLINNRKPFGDREFGTPNEASPNNYTIFKIYFKAPKTRQNIVFRYNEKLDEIIVKNPDSKHIHVMADVRHPEPLDETPDERDVSHAPTSANKATASILGDILRGDTPLARVSLAGLRRGLIGAAFARETRGSTVTQMAKLPLSRRLNLIDQDLRSSNLSLRRAASCSLAVLLPDSLPWIEDVLDSDGDPAFVYGLLSALNMAGEKPRLSKASLDFVLNASRSKDVAIRKAARRFLRRDPGEEELAEYNAVFEKLDSQREADLAPYVWFARTGLMIHYNYGIKQLFAYRDELADSPAIFQASADAALHAFQQARQLGAHVPDSEKIFYAQALYGESLLWFERAKGEAPVGQDLNPVFKKDSLTAFKSFLEAIEEDGESRYPYAHHIEQARQCVGDGLSRSCLDDHVPPKGVPDTIPLRADQPGPVRISHVKDGDVLNMRAEPIYCAEVVGTIPHDATDVRYTGEWRAHGSSTWGRVEYGKTDGWVNTRYLVGI